MNLRTLKDCSILIALDDFALAFALREAFVQVGADVIYPVNTIEDTLDIIMSSAPIDGAILGVNLQGEATFVAAEHLARRKIPFIFLVGHNMSDIPAKFDPIKRLEEPVVPASLVQLMISQLPA
ncbi:Chemotaxis protein CheY (plasmid) [Mesorhizobium loti]|nr:Chemotaxis protein CheY [Mesorhizobium loti]